MVGTTRLVTRIRRNTWWLALGASPLAEALEMVQREGLPRR